MAMLFACPGWPAMSRTRAVTIVSPIPKASSAPTPGLVQNWIVELAVNAYTPKLSRVHA